MIQRLKFRLLAWLLEDMDVKMVEGEPIWFVDHQRVDIQAMIDYGVPGTIIECKPNNRTVQQCVQMYMLPYPPQMLPPQRTS